MQRCLQDAVRLNVAVWSIADLVSTATDWSNTSEGLNFSGSRKNEVSALCLAAIRSVQVSVADELDKLFLRLSDLAGMW